MTQVVLTHERPLVQLAARVPELQLADLHQHSQGRLSDAKTLCVS